MNMVPLVTQVIILSIMLFTPWSISWFHVSPGFHQHMDVTEGDELLHPLGHHFPQDLSPLETREYLVFYIQDKFLYVWWGCHSCLRKAQNLSNMMNISVYQVGSLKNLQYLSLNACWIHTYVFYFLICIGSPIMYQTTLTILSYVG